MKQLVIVAAVALLAAPASALMIISPIDANSASGSYYAYAQNAVDDQPTWDGSQPVGDHLDGYQSALNRPAGPKSKCFFGGNRGGCGA